MFKTVFVCILSGGEERTRIECTVFPSESVRILVNNTRRVRLVFERADDNISTRSPLEPNGIRRVFFFLLHSAKYNDTSRVVGYVETCTFYGASLRLGMAYARTKPFGRVSRSRAIILHIFYSKFIRRPGRTRRRRNFENVCVAQRFYYVNGRKNVAHTHGSHLWWRREERKIK